jgi:HSP20 family protein
MSALVPTIKWNPLKEFEDMEKRLAEFFRRGADAGHGKEALTMAEWSPAVDITEDEKEYILKAELPGMKKEDIRITVQNDVLTISGERASEKKEKGNKYHRIERSYGTFMRSFSLPEDADGTKVAADCKDGLLKVHIPKSEKAKPNSVEVKVA